MGFFEKMKAGLARTRSQMAATINTMIADFTEENEEIYDELEEALILSDAGVETTENIIENLREQVRLRGCRGQEQLHDTLAEILSDAMDAGDTSLKLDTVPSVILVVGVNGVGKTTTIGKLASRLTAEGKKVLLCAGDTFRAAAAEQLTVWAERAGCGIVRHEEGSDPAAVVFDSIAAAKARGADVVIIDTAGRLHNKINLMNELVKIKNVIRKLVPDGPHEVLLVLDGSTGQNAFEQAKQFTAATEVNALAITKLDGTAKGGVVLGISDQFQVPIKYIGVGEKIHQLQIFNRLEFVDSLFPDNW